MLIWTRTGAGSLSSVSSMLSGMERAPRPRLLSADLDARARARSRPALFEVYLRSADATLTSPYCCSSLMCNSLMVVISRTLSGGMRLGEEAYRPAARSHRSYAVASPSILS